MKTDVEPGTRSSVLNETMNPMIFNGTGGTGKANFVSASYGLKQLKTPGSIMFKLLTKLRQILKSRYLTNDADGDSTDEDAQNKGATIDIQEKVLMVLKKFCDSKGWPSNDLAELQEVVSSYERSSTCRSSSKRSLAELNGAVETLPPAKRLAGTT